MSISKSCFILGLPAAGKTSYLAALAYSLQQRAVETKLHWRNFTDDHQYLTSLAETWLEFEPVSRTSIGLQQQSLSLRLCDNNDNVFDVSFPDLKTYLFARELFQIARLIERHLICKLFQIPCRKLHFGQSKKTYFLQTFPVFIN